MVATIVNTNYISFSLARRKVEYEYVKYLGKMDERCKSTVNREWGSGKKVTPKSFFVDACISFS